MEIISFSCSTCDKGFKVAADKAGRKTKCPKCGAALTVPNQLVREESTAPFADEDEDEESGGYGLEEILEQERPAVPKKTEVEPKKKRVKRTLIRGRIQFADEWEESTKGYLFVFIAVCCWGAAFLLRFLVLFIGLFSGRQYSRPADAAMNDENPEIFDWVDFAIGIIIGPDAITLGRVFYVLAAVLQFFQWGFAITGYILCMKAPNQHGTKGQLIGCISIAGVNLVFLLVFRMLPLFGAYSPFYPIQFPEITMTQANAERMLPLHVFWAGAPFWESFAAVIVLLTTYADGVLFCIFLYTCGFAMRNEWLETNGLTLTRVGLGQAFALLSFLYLSFAGTSGALQMFLQFGYFLWLSFFAGFLIKLGFLLIQARTRIPEFVHGNRQEDFKEEEDDERDGKPSGKKKRKKKASGERLDFFLKKGKIIFTLGDEEVEVSLKRFTDPEKAYKVIEETVNTDLGVRIDRDDEDEIRELLEEEIG